MKALAFTSAALLLVACSSANTAASPDAAPPDVIGVDSGSVCFPCKDYWICGGEVERIDLKPEADGCRLSGLPGRKRLAPDGTITENGAVLGRAAGTGARITVSYPDGRQWLFCAGGGGCR